jgi:8-oxo-dGTP pyrophosphatase MutT (NUDIX family)
MSWIAKDVKDIKPFIPGIPYVSHKKEEKKELSKSAQNKRGGIIAYTDNGDLFIVLQNVMTWSFPKGHFDSRLDHTLLDTAIREFREETNYPGIIDPNRLTQKMVIGKKHVFYLFKMSPEEVKMLPIIKNFNFHNEVLESRWVNLYDFDTFRRENQVNTTLSDFDILKFLNRANLSSFSPSPSSSSPSSPSSPSSLSSFGKNRKSAKKSIKKKSTKKRSTKKRSTKKRSTKKRSTKKRSN